MNKQRRFAIGDIHGNYKGLQQVLTKAGFDYNNDLLISLGDIADGYTEVPQCIEEVRKIKNFIWCLGNHDKWTQDWFSGKTPMNGVGLDGYAINQGYSESYMHQDADMWLTQGGRATYLAYVRDHPELISAHRGFWLSKPILYYVLDKPNENYYGDSGGICFVHAGFNRDHSILYQSKKTPHVLYWDRNLWSKAMSAGDTKLITDDKFDKIFLGHTSTEFFGSLKPLFAGGIWNLDTGGGWTGKITIMNIDTEEYFQSDLATELYPGVKARG